MQKIKRGLIEKAKVKKEYAKLKSRAETVTQNGQKSQSTTTTGGGSTAIFSGTLPTSGNNSRAMLHVGEKDAGQRVDDTPELSVAARPTLPSQQDQFSDHISATRNQHSQTHPPRPRNRPRVNPYNKEVQVAEERQAAADARRTAREKADLERAQKLEERERFRKAMAKARTGGANGQRKLGRESQVLLERVQRLVGS